MFSEFLTATERFEYDPKGVILIMHGFYNPLYTRGAFCDNDWRFTDRWIRLMEYILKLNLLAYLQHHDLVLPVHYWRLYKKKMLQIQISLYFSNISLQVCLQGLFILMRKLLRYEYLTYFSLTNIFWVTVCFCCVFTIFSHPSPTKRADMTTARKLK